MSSDLAVLPEMFVEDDVFEEEFSTRLDESELTAIPPRMQEMLISLNRIFDLHSVTDEMNVNLFQKRST